MQVRRRTNRIMRRRQTVATWLMLSLLVMHALFTLNCRVLHHHVHVQASFCHYFKVRNDYMTSGAGTSIKYLGCGPLHAWQVRQVLFGMWEKHQLMVFSPISSCFSHIPKRTRTCHACNGPHPKSSSMTVKLV